MKTRTHPDGSIWTRDGRLLWYYPARVEQPVEPAEIEYQPLVDEHVWDAHRGTYVRASRFTVQPEETFFNSDLIQTARGTCMVIDSSAQWVTFAHDIVRLNAGMVLQHENNNCIEILDDGVFAGSGVRYKFKAKPAVHMDALRAGERWTLLDV